MVTDVQKKDLELVKQHMTSIFRRQHKYVVYNPAFPERLIYTTMPAAGLFHYRPIIDDVIHVVDFLDPSIMKAFREIYRGIVPLDRIFFLHATMGTSLLTPKSAVSEIYVTENDTVRAVKTTTKKTESGGSDSSTSENVIAVLVDELLYERLTGFSDAFFRYMDPALIAPSSYHSEKISIGEHELGTAVAKKINVPWGKLIIPFLDGHSTVSVAEYCNRVNLDYSVTIHVGMERAIVRNMIEFTSARMRVRSCIPYSIQFLRPQ